MTHSPYGTCEPQVFKLARIKAVRDFACCVGNGRNLIRQISQVRFQRRVGFLYEAIKLCAREGELLSEVIVEFTSNSVTFLFLRINETAADFAK